MSRKRFVPLVAAGGAVLLAASFLAGAAAERALRMPSGSTDPAAESSRAAAPAGPDFRLLHEAWRVIDREYVDRSALASGPLTSGAISGMVDALGDTGHSTYLTPAMVAQERSLIRGEYVGVGLEITLKNSRVVIVAPLDGSPAVQAGLHAGEQILKVNGRSVADLDLSQVVNLIVGPVGTTVVLNIFDPVKSMVFDVPLRRARIHVDNVSWQPVPGSPFADLRVAAFDSGVGQEVRADLLQIEARKMSGIVLDLRDDPGGELGEAVEVASQFLAGGNVLLEKDAKGRITRDPARPGGVATSIPLVVLINEGTASGAEIVAGALRDARRATLIGQTTFGTGTVLENFPLSDGSALLLAVREWLTPAGRTIWHKGIVPDITVSVPLDVSLLTPADLKGMSLQALAASGDAQLKKALEVLGKTVSARR